MQKPEGIIRTFSNKPRRCQVRAVAKTKKPYHSGNTDETHNLAFKSNSTSHFTFTMQISAFRLSNTLRGYEEIIRDVDVTVNGYKSGNLFNIELTGNLFI